MKITNVIEIYDNGEFITVVTESGSAIHLPKDAEHSITVQEMADPGDHYRIDVNIDLYN